MSPGTADILSKLFFFMAAISACLGVYGLIGYQYIQMTRRDDD